MSKETKIQWTDATWNIARGCTKVDEDCKYCYMYRESLEGTRYSPREVVRTKTVFDLPLKYKKTKSESWDGPPLIFTSSLTDWAHESIDSYRNEMWDIIRKRPDLTFQLLTKRPERLPFVLPEDWGFGWDNVWLGTSIGSQESIQRAWELLKVHSKCYFLSLEPLHGEVDMVRADLLHKNWRNVATIGRYIDWVIVGGESGNENGKYKYRPCDLQWIEKIVQDCRQSDIPVFVKQLGTYLSKQLNLTDRHGGNMEDFPENLKFRQFPAIKSKINKLINR